MDKTQLSLAKDLWEEIRTALSMCGDIGDFSASDFEFSDIPRVIWEDRPVLPLSLLERIKELGVEINEVYWNAYEALAIGAARRLCFKGKMEIAFADALACVRTQMIGGHHTEAEQCIAQEIFLSGVPFEFEWDPHSEMIQTQILLIYRKFKAWQVKDSLYKKEIESFWGNRTA